MNANEASTRPPVQYVLVRRDLPVYVQMVHVGHACGEAILHAPISHDTVIRLLHVKDEAELRDYAARIAAKGIHVRLVEEPHAPYTGQAMALATEPTQRGNAIGKVVWHLRRAGDDEPRPHAPDAFCGCAACLAALPLPAVDEVSP